MHVYVPGVVLTICVCVDTYIYLFSPCRIAYIPYTSISIEQIKKVNRSKWVYGGGGKGRLEHGAGEVGPPPLPVPSCIPLSLPCVLVNVCMCARRKSIG
ncbi:hypothetical protein EON63_16470 [archaeon]|nr:MAG: hypothetical protein EON63_16470 [archaeon]